MRRAHGSGGQDDLAPCLRNAPDAALRVHHPRRAPAFHHHALGQHAGLQPQIGPPEHGLQEAARRAPAPPALLVHLEIGRAFIVAGVEVVDLGDADLFRGIPECVEDVPANPGIFHAPFAAGAVERVRRRGMVLVPHEVGQHVVPRPARQAELPPAVVIGRLPAHVDHGVDGRRTADHLAARIGDRAAAQPGLRLGPEHPVGARIADGEQVPDRDVKPDPVVAPARFQQQDPVAGVRRKPVGEDAAGRTGADDDVVVLACVELRGLGHVRSSSGG